MVFVGMHSIQGDGGEAYGAGLRAGLLAGGYGFGRYSFNGEMVIDWANPDPPTGTEVTQFMGDLAFSPLYHAPAGPIELVVGPKFGLWYMYGHTSTPLGSVTATSNGWTLGLNAGLLYPATPGMAAGLLLSYQLRDPTEVCVSSNNAKLCQGSGDAGHVIAFNAAMMF